MKILVTALSTAIDGVKNELVYIPEGQHTINASVNGKPKEFKANLDPARGEEIAADLDAQLQALKAENVRPFIDFDHNESGLQLVYLNHSGMNRAEV